MSRIEVKEMTLTDFKGQREKKVTFGNRTIVSGKNGCGKTTLADAFLWVLCDKDYSLKKNPDIRPDDGRECLPRVDIELVIDGKPVSIAKFQKKSESKPKNGMPVKVSLANKYEINGVPKTERDFKADLEERGFKFDNFQMLSHVETFLELKDADARNILFSMSDGVGKTDSEIAKEIPECKELVPLLEIYKPDEIKLTHNATLKKANEELDDIPKKIEGMELAKVDYDTAELELQKNALQEQIESIEKQISQSGDERTILIKKELSDLGSRKYALESKFRDEISEKRTAVQIRINSAQSERNLTAGSLNSKTSELERLRESKKEILKRLQDARTEYPKVKDTEWDKTELEAIESETFDESQTICPTCGQELPESQIKDLKEKFEKSKQDRISAQLSAKEAWEIERNKELESIIQTGNKASAEMKAAHEQEKKLEGEITELAEKLEEIKKSLEEGNKALDSIPREPDLSKNPEYQTIQKEISEKEVELSSLDDGEGAKKQLTEQLKAKKDELAAVHQKIGESNNNVRIDESIAELQEKRKEYSQESANAQMILDKLKTLSTAKNKILEDAVNQYFSGVRVKLFDTQKNGEVVDACIWYVQDKDGNWKKLTGNANTALVAKGKIAIIDGLQKFYGLSYPVFVDYAAELDNDSLAGIKADMQLIFLKVTEGDMEVTEV